MNIMQFMAVNNVNPEPKRYKARQACGRYIKTKDKLKRICAYPGCGARFYTDSKHQRRCLAHRGEWSWEAR